MALVCKAISLKLAQGGVFFTTFLYACLSSWPLSWCLGLCGEIRLITSFLSSHHIRLDRSSPDYFKLTPTDLAGLPGASRQGESWHVCSWLFCGAQDWLLGLVSGPIRFDKTYSLFLLNHQIGHDKSSLGISGSTLHYLPFGLCLSTLAFPGRICGAWSSRGSES